MDQPRQTKSRRDLDSVARKLEQRERAVMSGEQAAPRRAEAKAAQARRAQAVMDLLKDGDFDAAGLLLDDMEMAAPSDEMVPLLRETLRLKAQGEAMGRAQDAMERGDRQVEQYTIDMQAVPERQIDYPDKRYWQSVVGARVPVSAAPAEPALRFRKGTLVQSRGGGRSTGALPIAIDFPAPRSTTYQFVKPFLGRTGAKLWFRPVGRGAALAVELALAVVAFAAFLVLRARHAGLAVPFAAVAFLGAMAAVVAAPPAAGGLCATTALAMAFCLIAEALRVVSALMLRRKPQHDTN
jgi:hypothetical protein